MTLKDWKMEENTPNHIVFASKKIKDYDDGQPKHMQRGEKYRFSPENYITIMKQWKADDVVERDEKKAVWVVRDYFTLNKIVKTKQEALDIAKQFMRRN